jgi:hypothetical protein
MYVNYVPISGDRNVIKKGTENILKYKDLKIEIQRVWNVKKSDARNERGNWNHLRIIQKMPEQPTGRAGNQGPTEYSQPH